MVLSIKIRNGLSPFLHLLFWLHYITQDWPNRRVAVLHDLWWRCLQILYASGLSFNLYGRYLVAESMLKALISFLHKDDCMSLTCHGGCWHSPQRNSICHSEKHHAIVRGNSKNIKSPLEETCRHFQHSRCNGISGVHHVNPTLWADAPSIGSLSAVLHPRITLRLKTSE
jgi:hypothetical protein